MANTPQTYANHTRWLPPFHYFVLPVMLINAIWSVVWCVMQPSRNQAWWIVVSLALLLLTFLSRTQALKAQDRVIRLEERIRYQKLLPADLARQAASLTLGQIIALRFACDEELAGLIAEVLAGKFTKPDEIKRAIKNWRADDLRV
jgi:hypothetical protein